MLRDRFRFVEDSLILCSNSSSFRIVRWKTSFWFAWNSDIRVLGFNKDGARGCLDCTAETR